MSISDGEKRILLMVADLLDHHGVRGNQELVRQSILTGNLWALDQEAPLTPEIDAETKTKAVDYMEMWSRIEDDLDRLPAQSKQAVANAAPRTKFPGFDERQPESDYLWVARFFVEHLGKFQNFKGRTLDTHFSTLNIHRRMYAVYEPMRAKLTNPMTEQEIISVLTAA